MVEVEIEVFRPEVGETAIERLHEPRAVRVGRHDLRHEKELRAVVRTDCLADEGLRAAVAVVLRRIEQ